MTQQTVQPHKLRVAIVQMASVFGQVERNLSHAADLVEEAARQSVQLVLLPELMPSGYRLTKEIWDYAEPTHGRTAAWLCETAGRWGIWLGASFIEADGEDFYNTFVLANPQGKEAGRVRKTKAETAFFRSVSSAHVIETEIGRIGVGICADTHFAFFPPLMHEQDADLILMPHAWPAPYQTSNLVSSEDIRNARQNARDSAPLLARALGIPAVFTNAVGEIEPAPWVGIITGLMGKGGFHFQGLSTIADGDGKILAALDQQEGVQVTEITLDPARKHYIPPKVYSGGMLIPGSAFGRMILRFDEWSYRVRYQRSAERKRKARQAAARR
jgi:N-carbamoylputrescine amidase